MPLQSAPVALVVVWAVDVEVAVGHSGLFTLSPRDLDHWDDLWPGPIVALVELFNWVGHGFFHDDLLTVVDLHIMNFKYRLYCCQVHLRFSEGPLQWTLVPDKPQPSRYALSSLVMFTSPSWLSSSSSSCSTDLTIISRLLYLVTLKWWSLWVFLCGCDFHIVGLATGMNGLGCYVKRNEGFGTRRFFNGEPRMYAVHIVPLAAQLFSMHSAWLSFSWLCYFPFFLFKVLYLLLRCP